MNKYQILEWLMIDTEENADQIYHAEDNDHIDLTDLLLDLNNGRPISLPEKLPKTPAKMIPALKRHFKDNVTRISLVLNRYFPEQYLFYHVSPLEQEIFAGLEFFSDIVPEFAALRFQRVGRTGFNRYEILNNALLAFSKIYWPELKKPQSYVSYFLYEGLGRLFSESDEYPRYWVMASTVENFEALDEQDTVEWSGRKDMKTGDLVFMYRASPRSAITGLFRVTGDPVFDPWTGWGGFWIEMKRVCSLPDIPFATMKADSILSTWSSIRKHFNGTVTEPVPPAVYNRLLDFIPKEVKVEHQLVPEPVIAGAQPSGQFVSEAEFEAVKIAPMLQQWNFKIKAQYPCRVRVGGQLHTGWVDFLVSDDRGQLTLFENKLRIINPKDLERAVEQAKSYALHLSLPSFVVAAPEGFWVYAIEKNHACLVETYPTSEKVDFDKMKQQLLSLRS